MTAAFEIPRGLSTFLLEACLSNGKSALVSIIGATVLVVNVSSNCSVLTKDILVDFGATPALLNRTLSPSSLTISET